MDRAHIRSGALVRFYNGERGSITLENGGKVAPVVIGFENGNDKVVPYSEVVNDTSTQSNYVFKSQTRDVTETGVTDTTTIRDMTAEEIDGEKSRIVAGMDKAQNAVLWELIQRIKVLQDVAGINEAQMTTAKGNLTITKQQVLDIIKGQIK